MCNRILITCLGWAIFMGTAARAAEAVRVGDLLLTKEAAGLMSGSDQIAEVPAQTLLTAEQLRGDWCLTTYASTAGKQRGWISLRKIALVRLVEPITSAAASSAGTQESRVAADSTPSAVAPEKRPTITNDWEAAAHQLINAHRQQLKLPPFTRDERLNALAREHSQAMAAGQVQFGHAGFEQRLNAAGKVIPSQNASENVAYGSAGFADPAKTALEGWLNSEGHRRSIEGRFDLTGIGAATNARGEFYFTQIFVLRAAAP